MQILLKIYISSFFNIFIVLSIMLLFYEIVSLRFQNRGIPQLSTITDSNYCYNVTMLFMFYDFPDNKYDCKF